MTESRTGVFDRSATPRISVVMPVYNSEAYLAEALDSILAQSFISFEVLAIDDGSTDGSPDILRHYQKKDSRIVVISQENAGVAAACNAGISAARGEYIARMDADDVAWRDRFARQVAALDANPECVALGSAFRLVDPEGRILKVMNGPTEHSEIDFRLIRYQRLAICHPAVMLRADAMHKIGGYRSDFPAAEDIDLFLRLAEIGKLGNLPDILLDYRLHLASIGHSRRFQQMLDAWNAGKSAAERRDILFSTPKPMVDQAPQGPADIWRKWAWWALSSGEVATARHYAWRALVAAPTQRASWHLAVNALRGA
jgi:glycosyltransferase involved in cell wall biosynthesis